MHSTIQRGDPIDEERVNNKQTFCELLELVLGVAMQCEQSQEVIMKITELDEDIMNEL